MADDDITRRKVNGFVTITLSSYPDGWRVTASLLSPGMSTVLMIFKRTWKVKRDAEETFNAFVGAE